MNKLLSSHKSTAPTAIIGLCIATAAIGLLLFLLNLGPTYGMDDTAVILSWVAPICCFVAAVLFGVSAYKYTQCFINVYDDHVEGHGMIGKGGVRSQNFYAAKGQYSVNIEGNTYVCVQSGGVGYFLNLPADQAQQVYALANGMPYQAPVAPPAAPVQPAQPKAAPAPAPKAAAPKAPRAPKAPKPAPAPQPVQPPVQQPVYQQPVAPQPAPQPVYQQPVAPQPAPQYVPPQPQYNPQPQYQQPQYQAPQYQQPVYQQPVYQQPVAPQPQQPAMMIFNCPYCGTNCRVPAGRGPITITCPRCRNGFSANR